MSSRNNRIVFCAIVALAICFVEINGSPVDSKREKRSPQMPPMPEPPFPPPPGFPSPLGVRVARQADSNQYLTRGIYLDELLQRTRREARGTGGMTTKTG